MAALLGASALYAIAYGVQKYLHIVNQLSAKLSDVNTKLDTLSETTRHDFATQWQREFQSTLAEQQNELETIIKVQAEQLAKQSKQISWMNNMMTQAEQHTLIDSLQRQQETQQKLIELLQEQQEIFKVDVDKQKVMINNHTQYLDFFRCHTNLNMSNTDIAELNRICNNCWNK